MSRPVFLGAVVRVAFVVWCVVFVPLDMDQFESFHRIACRYPNAHWHTFREGCNAYPLRIGAVEYHRAYSHCEREEIARFFGGYEIAAVELGLRDWQVLKIAVPPAGGGAP